MTFHDLSLTSQVRALFEAAAGIRPAAAGLDARATLEPPVQPEAIEAELGAPISEIFSDFCDEPLGAASIGQAHAATLRGSGLPVVVKVQFPEARKFFRIDMRTIKNFCLVASPANVAIMDEIEVHCKTPAANLRTQTQIFLSFSCV